MKKWFVLHTNGNGSRKASADNSARLLKIYQGIGSVDECRIAVERMRPRNPIKVEGVPGIYCPNCSRSLYGPAFCPECGQAFIWPEEEEL